MSLSHVFLWEVNDLMQEPADLIHLLRRPETMLYAKDTSKKVYSVYFNLA